MEKANISQPFQPCLSPKTTTQQTPFILWLILVILTWRKISLLTVEQHKSWRKDFPNWSAVQSAAVVSVPDSVEQRKDKQWAMPLQSDPSTELKRGFVLWLVWRAERSDVLPRCSFSRSLGSKGHRKVEVETLFSPALGSSYRAGSYGSHQYHSLMIHLIVLSIINELTKVSSL